VFFNMFGGFLFFFVLLVLLGVVLKKGIRVCKRNTQKKKKKGELYSRKYFSPLFLVFLFPHSLCFVVDGEVSYDFLFLHWLTSAFAAVCPILLLSSSLL